MRFKAKVVQDYVALRAVAAVQDALIHAGPWHTDWVAEIAQGLNTVRVSVVADVRVEHEVKLVDFTKCLEKTGGSPREVSDRYKIRSILGMPASP